MKLRIAGPTASLLRRTTFAGILVAIALTVFSLDRLQNEAHTRREQVSLSNTAHNMCLLFQDFFQQRVAATGTLAEISVASGEEAAQFPVKAERILARFDGAGWAGLVDADRALLAAWPPRSRMEAVAPFKTAFDEIVRRTRSQNGPVVSGSLALPDGDAAFLVAARVPASGDRDLAVVTLYRIWRPAQRLFDITAHRRYDIMIKDDLGRAVSPQTAGETEGAEFRNDFGVGDARWSLQIRSRAGARGELVVARVLIWSLGLALMVSFGLFYYLLAEKNATLARYNEMLEHKAASVAESNRSLSRLNKELDDFTYTVAHDLKEPLRGIEGLTRLLLNDHQDSLDPIAREYLASIRDSGSRMGRLVDDLLRLSRITRRRYPAEDVDFNDLVREVTEGLRFAIESSHAQVDIVTRLPMLRCDRVRMVEVFQNLLSNALKYHGERPPLIQIGCKAHEDHTLFWVRDNGVGVPENEQRDIFRVFHRGRAAQASEGSGIGLAICKKIVEQHGGRIWVESRTGEGAQFCFTLKNAAPSDAADVEPGPGENHERSHAHRADR